MTKTQLELITSKNGNDVCCEVVDESLFLREYTENNEVLEIEITLSQFIDKVKEARGI